jgi:hypothetical protein
MKYAGSCRLAARFAAATVVVSCTAWMLAGRPPRSSAVCAAIRLGDVEPVAQGQVLAVHVLELVRGHRAGVHLGSAAG